MKKLEAETKEEVKEEEMVEVEVVPLEALPRKTKARIRRRKPGEKGRPFGLGKFRRQIWLEEDIEKAIEEEPLLEAEKVREIERIKKIKAPPLKKEPEPRYVNVDLVDYTTTKRCDPAKPLSISTEYNLRIDIGPWRDSSAVKDVRKYLFPDHILPKTEKGNWLDVIVTSEEFAIKRERYILFLPKSGASWVCNCIHKRRHYCKPKERDQYLYVPVKSSDKSREGTLRIGFYYRNNLLQSQLLTAQVGIEVTIKKMGYESEIDYTITRDLSELARFPARTLSIQTNENIDGSHRIILVGKEYIHHRALVDKTIRDAMNSARQELHDTHRKLLLEAKIKVFPDGSEKVIKKAEYENLLKELDGISNAKDRGEFITDIKNLANLGTQLWETLFQGYPESRRMLRNRLLKKRSPIQICRSKNTDSPMLFPWAMIYDINLDSDSSKWRICELLNDWKPGKALIDPEAEKCPYDDGKNHRMNLICPFGFWGFKHTLELPPSMPKGRNLPLKISRSDAKPQIAMGLSLKLERPQDHVAELRNQLKNKVRVIAKDSKEDIQEMLGESYFEFVYFFCHGRRRRLPGSVQRITYLEVGRGESITTGDIQMWQDNLWPVDHWTMTEPLVFINGCHTAELTPDSLVNFVDRFIEAGAGGVIGTEVAISQDLASEAALQFFSCLLEYNWNVGEAIHRIRNHFLSKGNMMGLAYTPYCSANLYLE